MTTTTTPTAADAETYMRDLLAGAPTDERPRYEPLSWDALMGDLYRAADQTWNVHLIDVPTLWAVIWANRAEATNADRVAFVRAAMDDTADAAFGTDASQAREMLRKRWEECRQATDHRTYAVPFDGDAMAMTPTPAEYDLLLRWATDGDWGVRPHPSGARRLFDVLVLT